MGDWIMANDWLGSYFGGIGSGILSSQACVPYYSGLQGSNVQECSTCVPGSFVPVNVLLEQLYNQGGTVVSEVRGAVEQIKRRLEEDLTYEIFEEDK
jgi:hypothetical protein